jgi:RNA polymerase sigma-70 factor (ECF subfamily)
VNEQEAIHRLKHGDVGGLAVLVERYQLQAIRTAYLITHDVALAEDVVQDVFLQIYRYIGSFDSQRPFAPWLLRCTANAALHAIKQDQGYLSFDDPPVNFSENGDAVVLADLLPAPDSDPEADIETAETEEQIEKALRQLSPEQRAAIVMRYYLDLSDNEMSEALNCAPSTVRWRLHTARKQLAIYLRHVLISMLGIW